MRRSGLVLCVITLAGGCESAVERLGTGARERAREFWNSWILEDWNAAYSMLDAASQSRCRPVRFQQLAAQHRKNLRFDPRGVQVPACEERGGVATAHIVLTGRSGDKSHRFKDAVLLRREGDQWLVVLPRHFGRGGGS